MIADSNILTDEDRTFLARFRTPQEVDTLDWYDSDEDFRRTVQWFCQRNYLVVERLNHRRAILISVTKFGRKAIQAQIERLEAEREAARKRYVDVAMF